MDICLPLNFLQFILQFIGGILIVLGITKALSGISIEYGDSYQSTQVNAIGYIYFGIFVVLAGALIIWGARSILKCVLGGQIIGSSFLMLVYALLSEGEISSYLDLKNISCEETEGYQITRKASKYFCSDNCICYIEQQKFPPNYLAKYNYTNTSTSPTNFQMCQQYKEKEDQAQAEEMGNIEIRYKCAGWCQPSPIYQFSDVNTGVPGHYNPNHTCYQDYKQEILTIFARQLVLNFALSLFFLITLTLSLCICVHPDRIESHERIYKFIKYFDDL